MSRKQSRPRTVLYLIAGCAALSVLGAGLASALASSRTKPQGAATPAVGSASPQLSAQARASFSVFAQPVGGSEDERIVDGVLSADKSLALDTTSVRLSQATGGIQVRVAGDSESVCLVGRIPGKAVWGGCAPTAAAVTPSTPGIGATAYPPGEVSHPGGKLAVDALFPNGTSDVALTSPDGSATPLSVVNNTVAFIADQDARLSWTGSDGRRYSASLPH
jgi:hypothetical protein